MNQFREDTYASADKPASVGYNPGRNFSLHDHLQCDAGQVWKGGHDKADAAIDASVRGLLLPSRSLILASAQSLSAGAGFDPWRNGSVRDAG
jgi:hypothetical protein